MGIGDVYSVEAVPDCYYVDMGLYGRDAYGSVYVYDTERPAVIDTGLGTNYEHILDALETVGIGRDELAYVVPTHVHLDHAGGAGTLAEETGARVLVHEAGVEHLVDPTRLWAGTKAAVGDRIRFYTEPEPIPEDRIEAIEGGETIDLGDRSLDVYHAPGHAFHQTVFHDADARAVFAADAAGIYVPELDRVVETSPPPGFDLEEVVADARMIEALNPETICYGHFGPVPAEGRIEEYVEVTRRWVEAVEKARAELDDEDAIVERFSERSETTEVWGERSAAGEIRMNVRGVLRYLDARGENG
ncbi:MBL fold metallo-hydrolase [Natronomonas sp. LN261]|jgi:glyoxylase-like metal-dependent hydrolase (beta-lactamase superfamily II)|uniref:MBL fold metallo-hydrolase n=1 Tax=Natronomonas sp. LN261 TaxID=2750669 RepID=UPI0015EE5098|nr:MBL fold metallo-hydrolase [Natronomonas sp. LN261]